MVESMKKNNKIKIFILLLLFLFFIIFFAFQNFDPSFFSDIDKYAKSVPSNYSNNIYTLTEYLIKPAKSDIERVRAIWIWITDNISYDVDGYFSGNISTYDAQNTFQKRKGVCSGYASLFKQMCDIAKIRCEIVTGYAKGYGHDISTNTLPDSNHAWNAIYIGNRWYLLDSTWGAGAVNSYRLFVKEYEEFYFCADPAKLIYTHFPDDPKWQLLDKPIDSMTFINLLLVWPQFFKLNLKAYSHPFGKIETDKKDFNISFITPINNVVIEGYLYPKYNRSQKTKCTSFVLQEGNMYNWRTYVDLNSKGEYYIDLFGGLNTGFSYTLHIVARYYIVYK